MTVPIGVHHLPHQLGFKGNGADPDPRPIQVERIISPWCEYRRPDFHPFSGVCSTTGKNGSVLTGALCRELSRSTICTHHPGKLPRYLLCGAKLPRSAGLLVHNINGGKNNQVVTSVYNILVDNINCWKIARVSGPTALKTALRRWCWHINMQSDPGVGMRAKIPCSLLAQVS